MLANAGIPWLRMSALVVALVCGLAASAYSFSGGTGEPNDPYQIATVEDLLSIGRSNDLDIGRTTGAQSWKARQRAVVL